VAVLYLPWLLYAGPRLVPYVAQKVVLDAGRPLDPLTYIGLHLAAFTVGHLDGSALALPTSATTVRVRKGKKMITDGPFAETKEQLAGTYILNCKDLDEAIEWASRIPDALRGAVEIRPIMEMGM